MLPSPSVYMSLRTEYQSRSERLSLIGGAEFILPDAVDWKGAKGELDFHHHHVLCGILMPLALVNGKDAG